MGLSLRTGEFGSYWGNDYNSSVAIGDEKRKVNATYIYKFLTFHGWSINAICGMLGNMQAESTINPGRWQSDIVGGDASGHGYSLVQWTPYTKYTNWCSENGFTDPSEMDTALTRILYEVANHIQWIGVGDYYGMDFKEFSQSTQSVSYLAKGFLLCYERPADQSESVQNYRASLAEAWYEYLSGTEPEDPTPTPSTSKKKKGYNWVLFNPRKRKIYG